MPSIKFSLLAVAAALVSSVHADYVIDPNTVSLTLRKAWCASETSTCPLICEQTKPYSTEVNTCDPVSLSVCPSSRLLSDRLLTLTDYPDLWLHLRQRPPAQRLGILSDPALLCLRRMGQPVRDCLRLRQLLLQRLPSEAPLRCPEPNPRQHHHRLCLWCVGHGLQHRHRYGHHLHRPRQQQRQRRLLEQVRCCRPLLWSRPGPDSRRSRGWVFPGSVGSCLVLVSFLSSASCPVDKSNFLIGVFYLMSVVFSTGLGFARTFILRSQRIASTLNLSRHCQSQGF